MTNYIKRAMIAICLCVTIFTYNVTNALELQAYNVGQANFNVLKRNGKNIVFDAGYRGHLSDQLRQSVKDTFGKTSYLFLSHYHADHFNLLEDADLRSCLPANCVFIMPPNEMSQKSNSANKLISVLLEENRKMLYSQDLAGKGLKTDDGICFWIYKMKNIENLSGNSLSQIVEVIYANRGILFTGDANIQTLQAIGAINVVENGNNVVNIDDINYNDEFQEPLLRHGTYQYQLTNIWRFLQSDIIVLPHHGSYNSGSYIFANLLGSNKIAIINSNPYTQHHLPTNDMINYIKQKQNNIYWNVYNNLEEGRIYLTSNAGIFDNQNPLCYHFAFFDCNNVSCIGVRKHNSLIPLIGSGHSLKKQPKLNILDYPSERLVDATNSSRVLRNVYDIYPGYKVLKNTNIKRYLRNVTSEQEWYTNAIMNNSKVFWNIPENLIYNAYKVRIFADYNKKFTAIESYMSFEKQKYINLPGNTKVRVINSVTGKVDKFSKKISKLIGNKESVNVKVVSEPKGLIWKPTFTLMQ